MALSEKAAFLAETVGLRRRRRRKKIAIVMMPMTMSASLRKYLWWWLWYGCWPSSCVDVETPDVSLSRLSICR